MSGHSGARHEMNVQTPVPRKSSLEFMQDYSDHAYFFIRKFFA
jgi:hypothetical protein